MQEKTRDVLDRVDKWLSAVSAVSAAHEELRRDKAEQAALDATEVELAAAIMDSEPSRQEGRSPVGIQHRTRAFENCGAGIRQ